MARPAYLRDALLEDEFPFRPLALGVVPFKEPDAGLEGPPLEIERDLLVTLFEMEAELDAWERLIKLDGGKEEEDEVIPVPKLEPSAPVDKAAVNPDEKELADPVGLNPVEVVPAP